MKTACDSQKTCWFSLDETECDFWEICEDNIHGYACQHEDDHRCFNEKAWTENQKNNIEER